MASPLAAAHSDAALGEKLLSFVGKFVSCDRLLVGRLDKSLRNELIKNPPFICIHLRAPSLQYIAKDRNFLVSDEGICHYTAPEGILTRASPRILANPAAPPAVPTGN